MSEYATSALPEINRAAAIDKLVNLIIKIIFTLFNFSLGVSVSVFLRKYVHLQEGCFDIWPWLLAAACISIVGSVFGGLWSFIERDTEHKLSASAFFGILAGIAQFTVEIWAADTYFNIEDTCLSG